MAKRFAPDDAWLKANFPDLTGLALLGQGGQKLVFSGHHATEGEVVLKIFWPNQSLDEVEREILAVSQVQSPHVPEILEQGTVDTPIGPCFWVREKKIDGVSLRTKLAAGPFQPLEVLKLAKEVSEALVRAETVSIVHRDVKPENIMVDTAGKYWLLDFGLARHLTLESLTATHLRFGKGTLSYAPPEQMRNDKRNIDGRADLFALGVTLYECATGVNPFRQGARDGAEVFHRVETLLLPALVLPINKSESFRDLISAFTQKRRDHRPANAAEGAAWISEVCAANGV